MRDKMFSCHPGPSDRPSKELQSLQKGFTRSPFCVAEVGSFYLAVEERATSPRPACARPPFILMRFQKAPP